MNVIIYGAGQFGHYAYWEYVDKANILCFLDKNAALWGTKCRGTNIEIEAPHALEKYPGIPVIIAVAQKDGIVECLKKYGSRQFIVYIPLSNMDSYITDMQIRLNNQLMDELNRERSIILGEFLNADVELGEMPYIAGGSGVLDYAFVMTVIRRFHCKKYLEFGTYIGNSINIAADLCDCCYSITASEKSPHAMKAWCKNRNIPDYTNRLVYKKNIVQYACEDTNTFDFGNTVLDRDIDIYYIDGDHSYEGVMSDTRNVFRHKKERAIVIWHDLKNASYVTALAIYNAIGSQEWKRIYCVDNNMCAIYLPNGMEKGLPIEAFGYTEERKPLYVYDTMLHVRKKD